MNVEALTDLDIVKETTLKQLMGNEDLEMQVKMKARELRVIGIFDKKFKAYKKKQANSKLEKYNLCGFNKEYSAICTGSWITNQDGIYKQVANNETGEVDEIEASRMMIVPSETYKNMDSGIEKLKLCFYKHGRWQSLICEKTTISNLHKIVELSNLGIDVNSLNSKDLMSYLYDCISLNQFDKIESINDEPDNYIIPHYKSVSRLGWVEKDFMPYNQNIKFDGERENKFLFECIKVDGDFKEWTSYTSKLRKNKLLRIQMATSFSSVLIEKLNTLPYVLHLWGGTGSGKTVGMIVAMSIWGNATMGKLTKTMNMTANSMMSTCAFLRNIPFAGDELQLIKNKFDNYDTLIMKICEGVERGRMTFSQNNEMRTWKNSFLFTGEDPITKDNSGGGVKNRVIEVDVNDKVVVENGKDVVDFISCNYGYAGIEFVKYIKDKSEYINTEYKKIFKNVLEICDTTEKQAMAISMILLGDRLACECIYKEEEPIKLDDVKEYLLTAKEIDVTERCYQFVMSTIATNINRFKETDNSGEIWGKMTSSYILFSKEKLSELMNKHNYDLNSMLKIWSKRDKVLRNSQDRMIHNTMCFGVKANYIKFVNEVVTEECKESFKDI